MTIVDSIENYLNTYMVFSQPDQARIIALWVLHTWTFGDGFARKPWTTPYLWINSLEPRCGKSTLIELLEPIVLNPEKGSDMTEAVMFRLVETVRPTLFLDEIDTIRWNGADEGMRNVLNSGYKHSGYTWRIARTEEGTGPTKFSTFSPKLLAGIDNGSLPETIYTRSLRINLRRVASVNEHGQMVAPDGTTREIYYSFIEAETTEWLTAEIAAFIAHWTAEYENYIPGIEPRQWEIVMPLVQIARRLGIEDEAREAIKRILSDSIERETPEAKLLRPIRELFDATGTDHLFTEDICKALGEGWTGKLLGPRLRKLEVGESTNMTVKNRRARGYYRHQFDEAFRLWL